MCKQLTLLAQSSDYRQIHICEHNMIHLTWDHSTLYLPAAEFEQLVKFVKRGLNSGHTRLGEGRFQMILASKGCYQVWLANAGLMLSAGDALVFADLIGVAFRQWTSNPPAKPFHKYEAPVSPNNLFSEN